MSDGAHKVKADTEKKKKLVKNFFRASKNDFWASRCWLQLARRANGKINFLCTLIQLRRRSDVERYLTVKNCNSAFPKKILRFKN